MANAAGRLVLRTLLLVSSDIDVAFVFANNPLEAQVVYVFHFFRLNVHSCIKVNGFNIRNGPLLVTRLGVRLVVGKLLLNDGL